jgi:hypothetical protein
MSECSSDNIMAKICAVFKANGNAPEDLNDFIKTLKPASQAEFVNYDIKADAEIDNKLPANESDKKIKSFWSSRINQVTETAEKILLDNRRPSGILGHDFIDRLDQTLISHAKKYGLGSPEGKAAYFKEIVPQLKKVDIKQFPEHAQGYARDYINFFKDGGSLYKDPDYPTGIQGALNNFTGNFVQGSAGVYLGHPVEAVVKLPALYTKEIIPAVGKFIQETHLKPWKKIERFERIGIYGRHDPSNFVSKALQVVRFAETPNRTLAALCGEIRYGGDTGAYRGAQEVMFVDRLADIPRQKWGDVGRDQAKLLNYALSTARMYAGMWSDLLHPKVQRGMRLRALTSLVTFHGMVYALGGSKALFPKPLMWAFNKIDPDAEEKMAFGDYKETPLTPLVQLGFPNQISVVNNMANSMLRNTPKNLDKAFEDWRYGDGQGAMSKAFDAAFPLLMFSNSPIGNGLVQKVVHFGKDYAFNEIDDVNKRVAKDFLPKHH